MDKILDGVQELLERFNMFALATCGGCGAVPVVKDRAKFDPGLSQVFSLRPLTEGGDLEAARATQRGAKLLHEGRVEESLRELHEARSRLPGSHEARCNLGCAYLERGDEDAALHWYREAHRLAPEDETTTLALASLESRAGQVADAQWLLSHYLQEVNGNSVGVLRQLGKLQQLQEAWGQAATTYRRLQTLEPVNPDWPANLQRCLEHSAPPFASPSKEGAMGLGGLAPVQHPSAWRSGVGDAGGGGAGVPGGASGQGANGGGGGRVAFADQLIEAGKLRESGHPVAALAAYKAVLRGLPNPASNPEVLARIADCQFDLGQLEGALESLKKVLSIQPEDPESNLRMAELMLANGQSAAGAEAYLKRAVGARADRNLKHRALCVTAMVAVAKEDYRQALSSASEAVRIDASSPQALLTLGNARLQVADYAAALRALSAAVEASSSRMDPESKRCRAKAHALCAQAHERQRQFPQAIEQAQLALDLSPQLDAAHVVRAMALHQSGRGREAVMELEAVLQHSPQNAPALLQLGYLQLCAGDARAVATLELAAFGTSAIGSALGAAKIYLALALDMHPERSSRGRPEQVLREGLADHRNLQCVWQEIEQGLGARDPMAAVQKLRGICDLDLSTAQARQLLGLLATATGRSDLSGTFSAVTRLESCDPGKRGGAGSRPGSVPPNRWAPTGSPGQLTPGHMTPGHMTPGAGVNAARQRSSSPARWGMPQVMPHQQQHQQQLARGMSHNLATQALQQPPPPWRRAAAAGVRDGVTPVGSGHATPYRNGRSASPAAFPVGV